MIIYTRYALAAIERIVGISSIRSRWTLTLRLMIVCNANGTRSTLDAIAGGTTTQRLCGLILDASL